MFIEPMRQLISFITGAFLFCILCSMSNCKEDKTPGPETTVHGVVKDGKSGEVYGGVVLQIEKQYSRGLAYIDAGPGYSYYDTVVTKPDGTYNLKFTPLGSGDFSLAIKKNPVSAIGGYSAGLVTGKDNTCNFSVIKLVNLTIHLKNNTNQGRVGFRMYYGYDGVYPFFAGVIDFKKPIVDTTFTIQTPHLSKSILTSQFYTGYLTTGPGIGTVGDTVAFRKGFSISRNDTLVNVINP
ncbi:MAG: hypothetical protein V4592_06380 [Bacteroidota bacterium]